MASNPRPTRRRWRPAGATPPRRTLAVASWRRAEVAPATPARSRRAGRIGLAVAAAVACYAVAVMVALWLKPLPAIGLLVLRTSHLDNLAIPPNVPGLNSAAALLRLAAEHRHRGWFAAGGFGASRDAEPLNFSAQLDKFDEKTIIVAVTGQVGADGSGAFLWKDSTDPLDSEAEASFRRVEADQAKPQGAPARGTQPQQVSTPRGNSRPNEPNKFYISNLIADLAARRGRFLLLLDVEQAAANVPLGMLRNDFNVKLNSLDPEVRAAGNVLVVAPGGGPGRDLLTPSGAETAFGRRVIDYLRGIPREAPATRGEPAGARPQVGKAGSLGRRFVAQARDLLNPPAARLDAAGLVAALGAVDDKLIVLPAPEHRLLLPLMSVTAPTSGPPAPPRADESGTPAPPPGGAQPASPIAAGGGAALATMKARWDRYAELDRRAPQARAPHLWRQYRDTLLRIDEIDLTPDQTLDLTTATTPAQLSPVANERTKLLNSLDDLGRDIDAAQRTIGLRSAPASLALPAVDGPPPESSEPHQARFNQYLEDLDRAPDLAALIEHRRAYLDLLLRAVADDPRKIGLGRIKAKLEDFGLGRTAGPIEADFLAILLRDQPPGALDDPSRQDRIGKAVRIRCLAERVAAGLGPPAPGPPAAYSYAEQVAPHLARLIDAGDDERRPAEDRCFATDPADLADADKRFDRALAAYARAGAVAAQVRAGLEARDRAFADLPYYASWALRRPEPDPSTPIELGLQRAWNATHELTRRLEADPVDPAAVAAAAEELRRAFDPVKLAFEAELARVHPGKAAATRSAILALLGTPFLTPDQRRGLRDEFRSDASAQAQPEGPAEEARRATWAGRLALEALGRSWLDDADLGASFKEHHPTLGPFGGFATLAADLGGPQAGPSPNPGRPADLTGPGERLGFAQRHLPAVIRKQLAAGPPAALDRAGALQVADRLARGLVGAQAVDRSAERSGMPRREPAEVYRRRLVQQLLLAQARRAIASRWYGPGDDAAPAQGVNAGSGREELPLYQRLALGFLDDLERLDGDRKTDEAARKVRKEAELQGLGRLNLAGLPDPLIVTDEATLAVPGWVKSDAEIGPVERDGRPVVWFGPDGRDLARPVGPADARRLVTITAHDAPTSQGGGGGGGGVPVATLRFPAVEEVAQAPGEIREPVVRSGVIGLVGRYRGQILIQPGRLAIHAVPEVIVEHEPPPARGSVALHADRAVVDRFGAAEGGGLVIVLDCSRSMGPAEGVPPDGPSKYREATAAIRQVLRQVTRGTSVSVWIFGESFWPNKTADRPEMTIQRVLEPTRWEPNDRAQLDRAMALIEYPKLEPWNESPLVETMIRARQDLRGVAGFKSMVVLTDGLDNCYARAPAPPGRPKPELGQALLDAFRDSGIEVNVVGYQVGAAEGDVRKQLKSIDLMNPPGHFFPVRQAGGLGQALAAALRPRLGYSIQTAGNILLESAIEGDAGGGLAPEFRDIDPGQYRLVVDAGARAVRSLTINRGDRLLVRLAQGREGVTLERERASDVTPPPFARDVGPWRLASLGTERPDARDQPLALQLTLERQPDRRETALEVIRPGLAWMEVRTADGAAGPFQQRWKQVGGGPAATWELRVPQRLAPPGGREGSGPALQPTIWAYWNPFTRGERPVTFSLAETGAIRDVRERSIATPRGVVVVESIQLEPLDAGAGDSRRKLVVRLKLPPKPPDGDRPAGVEDAAGGEAFEPFWVRPVGVVAESAEHRHYTRAGRYTGIFWPVTEDQILTALAGLELISVGDFRIQAVNDRCAVENLKANPLFRDPRPTRAIAEPAPAAPRPLPPAAPAPRTVTR